MKRAISEFDRSNLQGDLIYVEEDRRGRYRFDYDFLFDF